MGFSTFRIVRPSPQSNFPIFQSSPNHQPLAVICHPAPHFQPDGFTIYLLRFGFYGHFIQMKHGLCHGFLHLVCSQGFSMLKHILGLHSFLLSNNIPPYGYTHLSIYQWMNIWVIAIFWLLCIKVLRTFTGMCGLMFPVLWVY